MLTVASCFVVWLVLRLGLELDFVSDWLMAVHSIRCNCLTAVDADHVFTSV